MGEVYRTESVPRPQPETVAIHCSDPRFQPHFQEFLHRHLGLESYALIAVPGGIQCLTLVEDYLPKFGWAGWRWVKFLVGVANAPRAVLIAHEDCRWYVEGRYGEAGVERRQFEDLKKTGEALRERFGLAVESYYARREGEHVVFERAGDAVTTYSAAWASRRRR